MDLKCLPCLDRAIEDTNPPATVMVPDAVTMAPLAQQFNAGGQTIMAISVVPVCRACRKEQLGLISRSGLAVA